MLIRVCCGFDLLCWMRSSERGEPEATTLPPALNNNRVRAAASQLATFWSPPTTPKWET